MSPFLSLKKRLSISSKNSHRLSSHSSKSTHTSESLAIHGHPSPMDITYAVAFSPSTPSYSPPTYEAPGTVGSYAEMLDDDNMSWGTGRQSTGRQRRFPF
ncbi:hypothetical protein AZE42_06480 [Rhizopogon vesiculosus]|uniref:Uncharacterized protein n=1 Tax=Rhizopogon vesiculosus TaxID=180088 RepID=A0A1J8QIW2_9AGAM|nr:hypothetical protein AZE42_06480 [Rhizopogon vesiculosus]